MRLRHTSMQGEVASEEQDEGSELQGNALALW